MAHKSENRGEMTGTNLRLPISSAMDGNSRIPALTEVRTLEQVPLDPLNSTKGDCHGQEENACKTPEEVLKQGFSKVKGGIPLSSFDKKGVSYGTMVDAHRQMCGLTVVLQRIGRKNGSS